MLHIRNNLLDYELHDCLWNKYSHGYFMRLIVNKVFSNYYFSDLKINVGSSFSNSFTVLV